MGNVLSVAVLAVFVWTACVGLWRLVRCGEMELRPGPAARSQLAAGAAALGWGLAVLGLLCLAARLQFPGEPIGQTIRWRFCGGLDARHYLDLARWGYGAGEQGFAEQYLMIVFFPLWPLLLRPFALLGCDLWVTGTVLALGFTALGCVYLYRCTWRMLGAWGAWFACVVQLALPGSFFFVLPQTEALFFCLNFAFLDALQGRRCLRAGVLGLLAALCRANGVLLAGYAVLWCWVRWRGGARMRGVWALPVLGPALGIGAYLLLNWWVYGNPWQFTVYQKEHWSNGFCLFSRAVRTMYAQTASGNPDWALYLGAWTVGVILAEALLLALAARRLPPHWLLLGLAGFFLMNGQTWLISAQRYALGMPVLPVAAAALCGGESKNAALLRVAGTAVLAGLGAFYLWSFTHGAPIY